MRSFELIYYSYSSAFSAGLCLGFYPMWFLDNRLEFYMLLLMLYFFYRNINQTVLFIDYENFSSYYDKKITWQTVVNFLSSYSSKNFNILVGNRITDSRSFRSFPYLQLRYVRSAVAKKLAEDAGKKLAEEAADLAARKVAEETAKKLAAESTEVGGQIMVKASTFVSGIATTGVAVLGYEALVKDPKNLELEKEKLELEKEKLKLEKAKVLSELVKSKVLTSDEAREQLDFLPSKSNSEEASGGGSSATVITDPEELDSALEQKRKEQAILSKDKTQEPIAQSSHSEDSKASETTSTVEAQTPAIESEASSQEGSGSCNVFSICKENDGFLQKLIKIFLEIFF